MLGTVARMWRVTRTSWGRGGGEGDSCECGLLICRGVFYRGKMATMIATHGRNLRGSSNVELYLEAVIYTSPFTVLLWD